MIINSKMNEKSKQGKKKFDEFSLQEKFTFLESIYNNEFNKEYNSLKDLRKNINIKKDDRPGHGNGTILRFFHVFVFYLKWVSPKFNTFPKKF